MDDSIVLTEEHIAAAHLRLVIDDKLGRNTPEYVRWIALADAGTSIAAIISQDSGAEAADVLSQAGREGTSRSFEFSGNPTFRLLAPEDDVASFSSGNEADDSWLAQNAVVGQRSTQSSIYVFDDSSGRVLGYYSLAPVALSASAVGSATSSSSLPALLLARFALDQQLHLDEAGGAMLRSAIMNAVQMARQVGARTFAVQAEDPFKRSFFLSKAPFLVSSKDGSLLVAKLGEVESLLRNHAMR
ncbi:hypothetical protein [Amycolatopsis sp. cmx-4-61]|uniref:hypothetical protein n=1 Tax=Amycolatopsis sp. cmx-4-61 TaxID=2790937 RepID=UPI00397B1723